MNNLHIGIIPDGNRRYAEKKNITIEESYNIAFQTVTQIIEYICNQCDDLFSFEHYSISQVTLYVCSYDNLEKRSKEEVNLIYGLIDKFIKYYYKNKDKNTIRLNISGNIKLLPNKLKNNLLNIVNETSNNSYTLNLAIGYNGHQDIIKAFKRTLDKKQKYDIKNIYKNFDVDTDIDLVIRTGNEMRMSGFFPWQTVYAEWFFLDKFWPEFTENDLYNIIEKYGKRNRRYGK